MNSLNPDPRLTAVRQQVDAAPDRNPGEGIAALVRDAQQRLGAVTFDIGESQPVHTNRRVLEEDPNAGSNITSAGKVR
jgi:hypothetical protein